MSKVIKNREDFINENYYEKSSTAVPGAGVNAGTFPGAAANPEFFSVSNPQNLHEKHESCTQNLYIIRMCYCIDVHVV